MSLLEQVGRALCGDRWKAGLARLLGVSTRQVARWAEDEDRIPGKWWIALAALCAARAVDLERLGRTAQDKPAGRS